jgi:muramoyltetrapeptide carboxypeptidase
VSSADGLVPRPGPLSLQRGDRVALVSPASTPDADEVTGTVRYLESLGLVPEVGTHALNKLKYLAGPDEDRLADLNHAIRDPGIRAIVATRGGKGAYRIADGLDFSALAADPKLLIGFSEITILHLAIWKNCRLPGIHGAPWDDRFGAESAASFLHTVFRSEPTLLHSRTDEPTIALTTSGRAEGVLIGGNQDSIATAAGWALPKLEGAILLLEAFNLQLGHIDRQLTMLSKAGHLRGLVGVAVGQYTECGKRASEAADQDTLWVLRDRLSGLGVPILGGLPVGHGRHPRALPVGTWAELDADAGRLEVAPAVS